MGFEGWKCCAIWIICDDGRGSSFSIACASAMGVQTGQDKYPTNGEELIAPAREVIALDSEQWRRAWQPAGDEHSCWAPDQTARTGGDRLAARHRGKRQCKIRPTQPGSPETRAGVRVDRIIGQTCRPDSNEESGLRSKFYWYQNSLLGGGLRVGLVLLYCGLVFTG